jgi:hypothetical protein
MTKTWIIKKEVDQLFDESDHQGDVLVGLYRMVIRDWDRVVTVGGYPVINEHTGDYITRRFIAFDQKHHPKVLAGGLWMNNGFSTLDSAHLHDWEVDLYRCNTEYK